MRSFPRYRFPAPSCLAIPFLAACAAILITGSSQAAPPNLVIWDTGTKLSATPNLKERTDWKAVPRDLFALEADPGKASSDPGYYGREYSFRGDAVVENEKIDRKSTRLNSSHVSE